MDREDARLVASALTGRIVGDRALLDRLAASSLLRLSHSATVIRKRSADWAEALMASDLVMQICRKGGAVCDVELTVDLQPVVDSLLRLADMPAIPLNRAARRAAGTLH